MLSTALLTGSGPAQALKVLDRFAARLPGLRGVSYLASAGLGLLLEAAEPARTGGGRLWVLVEPGGSPARTLELAGLESLIAATPASSRRSPRSAGLR